MRIVFMGTPEFAVETLKALIAADHEILCVYSQPPRAKGRGLNLTPTPVHAYAQQLGIEVRTPLSLKSEIALQEFSDLKADAAVVVAYGLLLPQTLLDAPKYGCFNVHASLLPRWRGAAPIHRAIMAGDAESGVTIMRMELGLDTGPMVKVGKIAIQPETTTLLLHDQLAALGANLMVEVLKSPTEAGIIQPEEGVTYAKKIDKAEARIDLSHTAIEVRNHIHGLSPFPGAWLMMNDARVKILNAEIGDGPLSFPCADQNIRFTKLQREGKVIMDAAMFLRGFPNASL